MLTIAAAMFAGSAMAQSTTPRESGEDRKEEFKDLSVDEKKDVVIAKDREDMAKEKYVRKRGDEGNTRQQKKAMLIERYGSKEAAKDAMQERKADDTTNKERVENHKEEIIEKAGSKEAAKEGIQERRQNDNDNVSRSDVQNHKEQIIEKAGSEDAAKEKLQEKRQDRKKDK